MYDFQAFPVRPALADESLELPINVLQAMPSYVTKDPHAPTYDLRSIVQQLLHSVGDEEQMAKVMKVEAWRPGLEQTAIDFPGAGQLANPRRKNYPQYEIVHFVGRVGGSNSDPTLVLDEQPKEEAIGAQALAKALLAARTRLLVLHVPSAQFQQAQQLAERLVHLKGPAVLVVAGAMPATRSPKGKENKWGQNVDSYWYQLYINILHTLPLSEAADPKSVIGITASLLMGEGANTALQLYEWIKKLDERLKQAGQQTAERRTQLRELRNKATQYLHPEQSKPIISLINRATREAGSFAYIQRQSAKLAKAQKELPDHESSGVGPVSEVAAAIPEIEQTITKIEQDIITKAKQAPRVLNANFSDPLKQGQRLQADKGLPAGEPCALLVDVGPVWDDSIVTGQNAFPTQALPQGVTGWDVQVVLVSEDFTPQTSSALIWVPREGGRSFPYQDGKRAAEPGPAVLSLQAPTFPKRHSSPSLIARGRLCLYYENNLLQSARVKVGVVRTPDEVLAEPNEIAVDYVLTGGFQQIDRFATRAVKFGKGDKQKAHPIALNLTLNDDGSGSHRIIIKSREAAAAAPVAGQPPPPGWTKYDPAASAQALNLTRTQLKNCFFVRDNSGRANENNQGIDANNGKSREQFKLDLRALAIEGRKLFRMVTDQIRAEDKAIQASDWVDSIQTALAQPSVIQVARTGLANYVFPWALIYDIQLNMPKIECCKIIDEEWNANGIRKSSAQTGRCPHESEDFHLENIICPYGFWGLKHIIEQPLSALAGNTFGEAEREIKAGPQLSLAIGTTRSLSDLALLDAHLGEIKRLLRVNSPPPDATDITTLRGLLPASSVVYILCHGEYDDVDKQPYLSIGQREGGGNYRLYPTQVSGWRDTKRPPNLKDWRTRRPLIFINGCHTVNLTPGQLLEFVSAFAYAGASGVLGTEVSLEPRVAFAVARRLVELLGQQVGVGEAIYTIRWELANKGNLLGLAYTPYCLADLHLVFS